MERLTVKNKENIREIDEIGRIVIPLNKRKQLDINTGDKLEIFISGKNIVLKRPDVKIHKEIIETIRTVINDELELDIRVKSIKPDFINKKNYRNHYLRVIDELGRIVIPLELRKELEIKEKEKFKICVKDNLIILIKWEMYYKLLSTNAL